MSNLENLFASRFLKARKSNKLLSFLSITSVVGVMLGVATLITVVSVMDGFTKNLKSKFLGSNPHIIINSVYGRPMKNWEKYYDTIISHKDVTGVSPLVLGQAMVASGRNEISGVLVRGIDPEMEASASVFKDTVVSGNYNDIYKNSNILIGKEIAASTGIAIGEEITLISPAMSKSAFGFVPKMKKFRVAGLFDTGIHDHNKTLVYLNIKDAQDFFMTGDMVNAITVYVSDVDKSDKIAQSLQKDLNAKFRNMDQLAVRDWSVLNGALFAALKLEQFAMFVILTLIIIVASFNIVSMITVTVKDKRKEIAILRAMGGSERLIRNIFIKQGLLIGFIGTILGDILALIIGFVLKNFEIVKIPKEIYHSSTIPIELSVSIFILVTVCSVTITFLAAAIPARISAKINPIEAIRND